MSGRVEAVCVSGADLLPLPDRRPNRSGIDKRPVAGRVAVHPLGLDGDVQVNKKHHGGEGQAVYAYAQEDAEFWIAELGRELPPGRFGENLRTSGLDLLRVTRDARLIATARRQAEQIVAADPQLSEHRALAAAIVERLDEESQAFLERA